jgi:hypothetical protein
MKAIYWMLLALVVGLAMQGIAAPLSAQEKVVEHTVKGLPGKDIQVAAYLNVLPDCSSGPLPTIRLISPPAHGKLVVKKGNASALNYKQCLAFQAPAYVAFYRSQPDFSGSDTMSVEVRYQAGKTEIQKITVMIASPSEKGV